MGISGNGRVKVMEKYIEILCKQNPEMTLECKNPECNQKITVKSKDVFKKKTYKLLCPKCNKETCYITSKFVDDFKNELKKLGINIK